MAYRIRVQGNATVIETDSPEEVRAFLWAIGGLPPPPQLPPSSRTVDVEPDPPPFTPKKRTAKAGLRRVNGSSADVSELGTKVLRALENGPQSTLALETAVEASRYHVVGALKGLLQKGLVHRTGATSMSRWHLSVKSPKNNGGGASSAPRAGGRQRRRGPNTTDPGATSNDDSHGGVMGPEANALQIDEEGDAAIEDDDEVPIPPPEPRPRAMTAPHRVQTARTEPPRGPSWWLGKSRDELNAEAERRAPEMQKTREASMVKGTTRTGDEPKPRREC